MYVTGRERTGRDPADPCSVRSASHLQCIRIQQYVRSSVHRWTPTTVRSFRGKGEGVPGDANTVYLLAGKIPHPLEPISRLVLSTTGRARAPSDASIDSSQRVIYQKPLLWVCACVPSLSLLWRKLGSDIRSWACALLRVAWYQACVSSTQKVAPGIGHVCILLVRPYRDIVCVACRHGRGVGRRRVQASRRLDGCERPYSPSPQKSALRRFRSDWGGIKPRCFVPGTADARCYSS